MATGARWDRLDWLLMASASLVATVVRATGLGTPKELVFDEFYYVPDACRYAIQIPGICGPEEFTWMHPPLGKWLIGLGMQILGPTRYGWRLMPLIAGVLTVALVYAAGRLLLGGRGPALIAAGLLTFDFMHFVYSRLAMLDIFTTLFVLAALVCVLLDASDTESGRRPWRLAAGVCAGAAVACKWSGALGLIAMVVLVYLGDRKHGWSRARSARTIAVAFVLIPLGVYVLSYAGRLDGSLLAVPWTDGSWLYAFYERHLEMVSYHTEQRRALLSVVLPHPSSSPAWSWMLIKRPMVLFFETTGVLYREIIAMGHPVAWPLAVPALGWLTVLAVRARDSSTPAATLTIVFTALYLPWFVLTLGGQDPYPFYLLPAVPVMCLGLGAVAARLWPKTPGRVVVVGVAASVLAVFVFYLPLLTARPLSVPSWRQRILFTDCAEFQGPALGAIEQDVDPNLPLRGLDRAPRPSDRLFPTGTKATGWCWI